MKESERVAFSGGKAEVNSYVKEGIPPSGAVRVILENDLQSALRCWNSLDVMKGIACYIERAVPRYMYGSVHTVHNYLAEAELAAAVKAAKAAEERVNLAEAELAEAEATERRGP